MTTSRGIIASSEDSEGRQCGKVRTFGRSEPSEDRNRRRIRTLECGQSELSFQITARRTIVNKESCGVVDEYSCTKR